MSLRLAVTLAGSTPNPTGLPEVWPVNVEEIHDDSYVIPFPQVEMTVLEYDQHRAAYQSVFDAWELHRVFVAYMEEKFAALWQACHDYEYQFYSGGAYAQILELKLAGSTKAAAAGDWIFNLWADYYTRKYFMSLSTTVEMLDAISFDFSGHGSPPFTIPEMLAEAQGL